MNNCAVLHYALLYCNILFCLDVDVDHLSVTTLRVMVGIGRLYCIELYFTDTVVNHLSVTIFTVIVLRDYSVLCCAALCCSVLPYAVLCCPVLSCTVLFCTVLDSSFILQCSDTLSTQEFCCNSASIGGGPYRRIILYCAILY